ncbi:MAG TPA: GAF domain-containing protein [Anaerolineales bacterium]
MDSDQIAREEKLSEQLKRLIVSIGAGGQTVLLGSSDELLNSIVVAAARIFGAGAASILLVNEDEQVLEFKVAYGPAGKKLVGTKYPLDKGIAGYVVMTGQPIATSQVSKDARWDKEFAQSTGYVPESILATPLLSGDRIIGVMEVLDKINAASFGIQDMELLGMFARQAALAIDQAQQLSKIEGALVLGLKRLATADPSKDSSEILSVLETARNDQGEISDLLEIARLLGDISALGEAERRACLQILEVFASLKRSAPRRFG